MEIVWLTLDKVPDRFQKHPATVPVVNNLKYSEAPTLQSQSPRAAGAMVWHEVALRRSTAGEFEEQIAALNPLLTRRRRASINARSGNPLYRAPVVLVIHRRDHRFVLEAVLPRLGLTRADFDFALASQPYRARRCGQRASMW